MPPVTCKGDRRFSAFCKMPTRQLAAEVAACAEKMLRQQHDTAARRKNSRREKPRSGRIVAQQQEKCRQGRRKDLIGLCEVVVCVCCIEVCKTLEVPERETGLFFLRCAKRTKKHTRGLRTSGLRGRFKALSEVILQKLPAARAETGFTCKTAA